MVYANEVEGKAMLDVVMSALMKGITASAGKIASTGIEDAYAGLKSIISRKLGADSESVEAIQKLEAKPDSSGRRETLREELATANIGEDSEIVEAAKRLDAAVEELPPSQLVQIQHASGSYIAQASGGSTAKVTFAEGSTGQTKR